jgi:hypothetical protein
MVDRRQHRGAHPDDARDFRVDSEPALRTGTFELSWLLERGYSERAALKLVGDKHQLTGRQREAIARGACTDSARSRRLAHRADPSELVDATLGIDGFNCLITLEVMLSRGPVFVGRDGVLRDLASVHGTYRRVSETEPAIDMVTSVLAAYGVRDVRVLLDRPVANSGRLRGLFLEAAARHALSLECELSDRVDQQLVESAPLVASSDSWVLDHAGAWLDLPALLAERHGLPLWLLRLA